MNVLLVNPTHPSTPHISAVRAWRFAQELSKLGHRTILLCGSKDTIDRGDGLARHDWEQPYVLSPGPARLDASRHLPRTFRRPITAWNLLRHGGGMGAWARVALQAAIARVEGFLPSVVWTTFGKLEAVLLARRLAGRFGCPWVLDIKDNWELYVPAGMRRLMVARTRGWTTLTANARFTAEKALRWQGASATVIYSGVEESFFRDSESASDRLDRETFRISIVGGLYFADKLLALLQGIQRWYGGMRSDERDRVRLAYLGGNEEMFSHGVAQAGLAMPSTCHGYLPVDVLAQHCRHAAVNTYIAHGAGFHHKLLELLATGRPVLAFPPDGDEARALARSTGGELLEPRTPEEVVSAFDLLHTRWVNGGEPNGPVDVTQYSWAAQAKRLDEVLMSAVRRPHDR